MNKSLEFHLFAFCLFLSAITCLSAESSTYLMVYKEGGAPAVFKSPKCPRWKLSDHNWPPKTRSVISPFIKVSGRLRKIVLSVLSTFEFRFLVQVALQRLLWELWLFLMVIVVLKLVIWLQNFLLEYFMLHTYFLLDATFPSFLKKFLGKLSNGEVVSFSSRFLKDRELILHVIDQESVLYQEGGKDAK